MTEVNFHNFLLVTLAGTNGELIIDRDPQRWSLQIFVDTGSIRVTPWPAGFGGINTGYAVSATVPSPLFKYSDYLTMVQGPWYSFGAFPGTPCIVAYTYTRP